MKHLALFNGIGGFQLAADWIGWKNIAHVEINPFCNKVVKKHFPESKCYKDIKKFNGKIYEGTIDIISGGFPCQPFSTAGKQRGKDDDRNLWPEMFRIIREIHPTWVVCENVANFTNFMEFENTVLDLESESYEVQPFIIPAVAVGAWHKRDRVWIVANTNQKRLSNRDNSNRKRKVSNIKKRLQNNRKINGLGYNSKQIISNTNIIRQSEQRKYKQSICSEAVKERKTNRIVNDCKSNFWEFEPNVGRVANGVSDRVDRLKALGNAIVPQVAYEIFKLIDEINKQNLNL